MAPWFALGSNRLYNPKIPLNKPTPNPVKANVMKTLLKSTALGLAAMLGFSSCAYDPYNAGQGNYGGQSVVPAIATGVAIAALAGYANERSSRKRAKSYNYAYGGYGGYNPYRGGHHGGRHCSY